MTRAGSGSRGLARGCGRMRDEPHARSHASDRELCAAALRGAVTFGAVEPRLSLASGRALATWVWTKEFQKLKGKYTVTVLEEFYNLKENSQFFI